MVTYTERGHSKLRLTSKAQPLPRAVGSLLIRTTFNLISMFTPQVTFHLPRIIIQPQPHTPQVTFHLPRIIIIQPQPHKLDTVKPEYKSTHLGKRLCHWGVNFCLGRKGM